MSEIRQSLHRLASSDPSTAEAALARLTVLGARVVEPLLELYPAARKRGRLMMMLLLARVGDARSLDLLQQEIVSDDAEIRAAAAGALGEQRSSRARSLLAERLPAEEEPRARETIVRALARDAADGAAELLDMVLDVVFDRREGVRVRMAGLPALSSLPSADVRRLLEKLAEDPDDPLAAEARVGLSADARDAPEAIAGRLATADDRTFAVSSLRLRELGLQAVPSVLRTLETHVQDPEASRRCVWTLEGMPQEARRDLAHRLDPDWSPEMLGSALKALGGVHDRQVLLQLKRLVEALAGRIAAAPETDLGARLARVRAQAHLLLARAGSRLAIADLKDALASGAPGRADLIAALAHIGRAEDAGDLLAVHLDAEPWLQERIRDALLLIGKRVGVTRLRRVAGGLPPRQSAILSRLLAPPRRSGIPGRHEPPTESAE